MQDLILDVIRIVLALVFAVSCTLKLIDRTETINNFRNLYRINSELLFWVLVAAEFIAVGLLMVAPVWGAYICILMLASFTTTLLDAKLKKQTLGCKCFGKLSKSEVSAAAVGRNLILIAAAIYLVLATP